MRNYLLYPPPLHPSDPRAQVCSFDQHDEASSSSSSSSSSFSSFLPSVSPPPLQPCPSILDALHTAQRDEQDGPLLLMTQRGVEAERRRGAVSEDRAMLLKHTSDNVVTGRRMHRRRSGGSSRSIQGTTTQTPAAVAEVEVEAAGDMEMAVEAVGVRRCGFHWFSSEEACPLLSSPPTTLIFLGGGQVGGEGGGGHGGAQM